MAEPLIERKHRPRIRKDTTISLLERKLQIGMAEARTLLHRLEEAMVRCGYVRDGIYNSRAANWSGKSRHDRATVLHWERGQIKYGLGFKKDPKTGKALRPFEPIPALGVDRMNAHQLIAVAGNLAPFLDSLEDSVRWQVEAIQRATQTVREFLTSIEADPKPSDEPAQHDPDPDSGAQEDPETV